MPRPAATAVKMIEMLVKACPSLPDQVNGSGVAVLGFALAMRKLEVATKLLQMGAKLDEPANTVCRCV